MKRIFLIGFMGSGKTTIGSLLAQKLDYSFIDLDHYIEKRVVKKITDIFDEKGEDGFRELEHKMLLEVSMLENVVISTGGGAACFHNNMDLMNETGLSIYLKLSTPTLVNRLQKAKDFRPLIKDKTDEELVIFIDKTLETREKYYLQATLVIDNDDKNPTNVCAEIISILHKKLV